MDANKQAPVAFITGASYGVGAASALALAKAGRRIAISATRVDNLANTISMLKEAGVSPFAVKLDLGSTDSIDGAIASIMREFGDIDVLVNNAAANLRRPAVDISLNEWSRLMAINVTGPFFLTQRVGRRLIERKLPGCIVNITSTHALVGAPERSAYGISKAALSQMTKMLAVEWAPYQIRVNAIAPGRMATDSPSRQTTGNNARYMKEMLDRIPLQRLATAEEVAKAVAFLASAGAASITGQTIVLDGGLTAI